MKLTIQNTDYEIKFGFYFKRHFMKKHRLKTFVDFDKYIQENINFFNQEQFTPKHFEFFCQFAFEGICWHTDKKQLKITLEAFTEYMYTNMHLLGKVLNHYKESQPKETESNPVPEGK